MVQSPWSNHCAPHWNIAVPYKMYNACVSKGFTWSSEGKRCLVNWSSVVVSIKAKSIDLSSSCLSLLHPRYVHKGTSIYVSPSHMLVFWWTVFLDLAQDPGTRKCTTTQLNSPCLWPQPLRPSLMGIGAHVRISHVESLSQSFCLVSRLTLSWSSSYAIYKLIKWDMCERELWILSLKLWLLPDSFQRDTSVLFCGLPHGHMVCWASSPKSQVLLTEPWSHCFAPAHGTHGSAFHIRGIQCMVCWESGSLDSAWALAQCCKDSNMATDIYSLWIGTGSLGHTWSLYWRGCGVMSSCLTTSIVRQNS